MGVPLLLRKIWAFRNTLIVFLTPLLLLPIPIAIPGTESACGYTILLMAIYWITEAIPLAVTAFLPLIIFPLSGIMTGDEVAQSYFKDTSWLFIGGMFIAISVEVTGLHKRIALRVLLLIGVKPRCLMLGFMLTTFFLSMWISNTASTAMMLPIVEAVFRELKADSDRSFKKLREDKLAKFDNGLKVISNTPEDYQVTSFADNEAFEKGEDDIQVKIVDDDSGSDRSPPSYNSEDQERAAIEEYLDKEDRKRQNRMENLIKGVTLCVPYAASIGGTATLTGTTPNLILSGQYEIIFPGADIQLSFANWMIYCLPGACVLVVIAYLWMSFFWLGFDMSEVTSCLGKGEESQGEKDAKRVVRAEYDALGDIKWGEVTVLLLFITTALLWFFRDPGFIPGWAIIFPEDGPTDGTVAMTMGFLLFLLPGERPSLLKRDDDTEIKKPVKAVLVWPTVHKMFPWDIMFLLTGGFALADGAVASGFSAWMGELLSFLDGIETWAICLVCTIIVCVFTECSSNTATSALFVPILADLAVTIEVHPLYLMLPPVVASSLAFMLPVATPPNAIAFSYGHVKVIDLVKSGWFLNAAGVAVISLFINTYGMSMFGLSVFPEWAAAGNATEAPPAAF